MDLTNEIQVSRFMMDMILEPIVEKITKKILAITKDNILKYAYQGDEPPVVRSKNGKLSTKGSGVNWYLGGTRTPSFEFLNAFKWDDFEKSLQKIVANMVYDWKSMEYDGSTGMYKHGNEYSSGDVRQYLDEILDGGVTGNGSFTSTHWLARYVRPYWKKTISELFEKRRIEIEIRKYSSQLSKIYGVKIQKVI